MYKLRGEKQPPVVTNKPNKPKQQNERHFIAILKKLKKVV